LLALLALPACDFSCGDKKSLPDAAQGSDSPNVEVINVGREPRELLQVARWTGLTYRVVVENDVSFGLAGEHPVRAPILILTMRVQVLRGTADPIIKELEGRKARLIEERAVVEKVEVKPGQMPPEAIAVANLQLLPLAGSTVRQLVAEDGQVVEMKTELIGGAPPDPQIKRMLDEAWDVHRRFPFRLPSGPVGVGARWRFNEPIEVRGVRLIQLAELQIVAMDASAVKIRIRVRHQAPRQEIPHPLDPKDVAMLDSYRGDGDGQIVMDRMTAVPFDSRLTTTAHLRVSVPEDGGSKTANFIAATRGEWHSTLEPVDGGASARDGASTARSVEAGAAIRQAP
jgi:hypothetical protein